jgi:hypothetical protein
MRNTKAGAVHKAEDVHKAGAGHTTSSSKLEPSEFIVAHIKKSVI